MRGVRLIAVDLEPGAVSLPEDADFDSRRFATLEGVAEADLIVAR